VQPSISQLHHQNQQHSFYTPKQQLSQASKISMRTNYLPPSSRFENRMFSVDDGILISNNTVTSGATTTTTTAAAVVVPILSAASDFNIQETGRVMLLVFFSVSLF